MRCQDCRGIGGLTGPDPKRRFWCLRCYRKRRNWSPSHRKLKTPERTPISDGPIRIMISTKGNDIARQVLEFSIKEQTLARVKFETLDRNWYEGQRYGAQRFGRMRFMIPHYFGYRGRAIHLDADMLVFGDILELWEQTAPPRVFGPSVGVRFQRHRHSRSQPGVDTSMMVLDCSTLSGWESVPTYVARDAHASVITGEWWSFRPWEVEGKWNDLDHYEPETKLIHYTRIDTQPWRHPHHPNAAIWREWLERAVLAGAIGQEELAAACLSGELSRVYDYLANKAVR